MPTTFLSKIRQAASGVVGLVVQRVSSGATGDLQQWQSETGAVLLQVASDGRIYMRNNAFDFDSMSGQSEWRLMNDGNAKLQIYNAGAGKFHWVSYTNRFDIPGSQYTSGSNTVNPLKVRGLKSTASAPADGTWNTDDIIIDSVGNVYLCTAGGTPGTWTAGVILQSVVTTKGDLLAATGSAAVSRLAVGSNGQVLTADSAQSTGVKWTVPGTGFVLVVSLTDGATIATDASLGTYFRVAMAGDRTFSVPTNPIDGQRILYELTASSADRTPAFTTGANGFAFGTDITAVGTILSGTTCYVGFIYNSSAARWRCLAVAKGY